MEKQYFERVEESLMGVMEQDLNKLRQGMDKPKGSLRTLQAKAKATVAEPRKGGQVSAKKAGTALCKEREKLFLNSMLQQQRSGIRLRKKFTTCMQRGAAGKLVSPQNAFRPLDLFNPLELHSSQG